LPAWFYILRLASGGLYIGFTRNFEKRMRDHFSGRGCRTTRLDPPIHVAYIEKSESISTIRNREWQVKKWSRSKKEALIRGDITKLKRLAKRRNR